MIIVHSKQELDEHLAEWRQHNDHVALVPTMGNLSNAHLSLVELAREQAERVVVSIFVNPTQFGNDADYDAYPRTFELDTRRLKKTATSLIFAPSVETLYPFGVGSATIVSVPHLTDHFCGKSRPGHFDGVTSVVARLFALVQPDVAVFGQKDYQRQVVIRHMSADLNLPIGIVTGETIREDDGLAMSSRNRHLTTEERNAAPELFALLSSIGEELQNGKRDFEALEVAGLEKLEGAGFDVEYLAIRRAQNLEVPDRDCDELVVLAAATLGTARLIDNVVVTV